MKTVTVDEQGNIELEAFAAWIDTTLVHSYETILRSDDSLEIRFYDIHGNPVKGKQDEGI